MEYQTSMRFRLAASAALCAALLLGAACGGDELAPLAEQPPLIPTCEDGSDMVDGNCPVAPGSIEGFVCHIPTGEWLEGIEATVVVDGSILNDTTDTDGRFLFENVPPGSYFVELVGESYHDELVAHVTAGQTAVIGDPECGLPPGRLRGRVCNEESGQWVGGATVTLDDPDSTTVTADNDGFFEITGLQAGDYTLTISGSGYSGTRSVNVAPGTTTDIGPTQCLGGDGSITGRICGGDGYWLSGARVFIDLGGGTIIETTTDGEGRYTLTGVPAGSHTVQVTRGSFSTTFPVTVGANEDVTLPEPVCIPPTTNIAVVTGIYDSVETVLEDLGFPLRATYTSATPSISDPNGNVDLIAGDTTDFWLTGLLTDPAWMADYDIIFFNCGVQDSVLQAGGATADAAVANLQDFVQNGGSVYASDWASEIVRLAFPGAIDFYGSDTSFGDARVGQADSNLSATAVDAGLVTALGRTDLTINLDLSAWVVMQSVGAQPSILRVLVQGDVDACSDPFCFDTTTIYDAPLVVRFNYGYGRVLFTSAHNESQTTPDLRDVLNYVVFEL